MSIGSESLLSTLLDPKIVHAQSSRLGTFKVTGYSFMGNNSKIFIFASILNGGHVLKEKKLHFEQ